MIVAGLAPLVGLSALAAGLIAAPGAVGSWSSARLSAPAGSSPRLLRAVVPFVIPAAEATSASSSLGRSAAPSVLALEALAATPFRGSLCLLASLVAVDVARRRHQRVLLRC